MRTWIVTGLLLLVCSVAFGQRDVSFEGDPPPFRDRVFFGGGLGLGGGSDVFYVSLSPLAGYMITPKWSAGAGINYTYYNDRRIDQDDHQYGFLTFTRYNIYRQFFLQAQYEYINFTRFVPVFDQAGVIYDEQRDSYSRVLLGGGITQPIGPRGAINLVAMYDLNHTDSKSPYASPWVFQIYFSF